MPALRRITSKQRANFFLFLNQRVTELVHLHTEYLRDVGAEERTDVVPYSVSAPVSSFITSFIERVSSRDWALPRTPGLIS